MTREIKCAECHGTGFIEGYTNEGDYSVPFRDECIECDGNGSIEIEIDEDDE
jgi:DnaJ-class molecular chaperone